MVKSRAANAVREAQADYLGPGSPWRSIVSLLFVIHLFALAVVLSANLTPRSALLSRLAVIMRPYAGSLHLDPDGQFYYLTYPTEIHDDQIIEVLLGEENGGKAIRLTTAPPRVSPAFQRQKALARTLATFAYGEGSANDSSAGEIAKAVGARVMAEQGVSSVVVRLVHHRPQPRIAEMGATGNDPESPFADEYYNVVYQARVWRAADGSVQVLKMSARGEVAAPSRED